MLIHSTISSELPFCAGAPSLFLGASFSGKTPAMITMAVALTAGKPIWRRFPCATQGRVAYIGIEYHRDHVLDMFCRAGEAMELDPIQLFRDISVHTIRKSIEVEADKLVNLLRSLAKNHVAVFIDDAYSIVGKEQWSRFVDAVTAVSHDSTTPFVLSRRTPEGELDRALNLPNQQLYEGAGATLSFCQVRGDFQYRRIILVNQPEVYRGSFPMIDGVLKFDAPPVPTFLSPRQPMCATFSRLPVERRELVRATVAIENPALKNLN